MNALKRLAGLALASSALLAACLPEGMQVPQDPMLAFLERKSGQIAYVGRDANIYVVDQGGRSPTALTDDAVVPEQEGGRFHVYHLPAWSRDSARLAFVGLSGQGGDATSDLYIADVEVEGASTSVYRSALELPYFLNWSPDNATVGFLSTSGSNTTQILQTAASGRDRLIVDAGAPYYWSWAPDGSAMIVHTADPAAQGVRDRVAFLTLHDEVAEVGLDFTAGSFQAPAWSPDGNYILVAESSEDSSTDLVLLDSAGARLRSLAQLDGDVAFAWSFDSQLLAYIAGDGSPEVGTLGPLHVLDLDTSEEHIESRPVFAFFWSPDGREVAYFVPQRAAGQAETEEQPSDLILELNVLDVDSGESRVLLTFRPSNQFGEILPVFDQYHQSATIWSPDSNNIVLSFLDSESQPGIAVVAASGSLEPRYLAEGVLAFWSWK